jgi:hypothetical protein
MVSVRFARRPSTQTSDAKRTPNAISVILGAPGPFQAKKKPQREKKAPLQKQIMRKHPF